MKGKKLKKIINKAKMSARFDFERSNDFDLSFNQNSDVDDCLDLHGYTRNEAISILEDFIDFCLENNLNKVRIITGIGSDGYSVLKNTTKEYLISRDIKFSQSSSNRGGEGALDVFI